MVRKMKIETRIIRGREIMRMKDYPVREMNHMDRLRFLEVERVRDELGDLVEDIKWKKDGRKN